MRSLRRLGISTAFILTSTAMLFGACSDETEPEGKCDPGENIFCRCPGGDAGTRECLSNGEEFAECFIAPETPCGERIECDAFTTIPCLCPNGTDGTKECLRDETGYDECVVAPGIPCPVDTSGSGGSGAGTTGTGAGSPGECTHDVCDIGEPLTSGCDPCVTAVCEADDYCCNTAWDSTCIGVADSVCDGICSPPPPMCEHALCEAGTALATGCDPCVTSVCTTDDYCCDTTWDQVCIGHVKDGAAHPSCSGLCCAHSECSPGAALDANCSICAGKICLVDDFCCSSSWDSLCVEAAQSNSSCTCN